jgi:hypothetical protein
MVVEVSGLFHSSGVMTFVSSDDVVFQKDLGLGLIFIVGHVRCTSAYLVSLFLGQETRAGRALVRSRRRNWYPLADFSGPIRTVKLEYVPVSYRI